MTRSGPARTDTRLDHWPAAGIATARAKGWKTPRNGGFVATVDGQNRLKIAGFRRNQAYSALVTHICRNATYPVVACARLKSP
jgi:hypothetical protein